MLSIGEFSKIYSVSAKTLRYYAEIGLILPIEINPEKGRDEKAITRTGKGPASTGMRHIKPKDGKIHFVVFGRY